MTPAELRARGIAARMLANDETIQDAFRLMEAEIMDEWARSDWIATIWPFRRHRLWHDLQAIRRLRHRLNIFAADAPRD